jgi:hypothetical protein
MDNGIFTFLYCSSEIEFINDDNLLTVIPTLNFKFLKDEIYQNILNEKQKEIVNQVSLTYLI